MTMISSTTHNTAANVFNSGPEKTKSAAQLIKAGAGVVAASVKSAACAAGNVGIKVATGTIFCAIMVPAYTAYMGFLFLSLLMGR